MSFSDFWRLNYTFDYNLEPLCTNNSISSSFLSLKLRFLAKIALILP